MREIKFRAWDFELNRMSKSFPLYSPLIKWSDGDIEMPIAFGLSKSKRFIIMQYTTAKDRHGKEAYHKDIVKTRVVHYDKPLTKERIGVIEWDKSFYCWVISYNGGDSMLDVEFEIIGNIYENPELRRGVK